MPASKIGAALLGEFVQHLVDAADLFQHFGVVLAYVRLAVGLAGRNRDAHLVGAGRHRPLHALEVRRQGGDVQTGDGHGVTHEFLAVGHLRQQFGGHEGAHFDFGHARGGLRPDPGLLGLGGHDHLEALQAVARPHFAYEYVNAHRPAPGMVPARPARPAPRAGVSSGASNGRLRTLLALAPDACEVNPAGLAGAPLVQSRHQAGDLVPYLLLFTLLVAGDGGGALSQFVAIPVVRVRAVPATPSVPG